MTPVAPPVPTPMVSNHALNLNTNRQAVPEVQKHSELMCTLHTCINTALVTTAYTVSNGYLIAYQIVMQSLQQLPSSSNGNAARATCERQPSVLTQNC